LWARKLLAETSHVDVVLTQEMSSAELLADMRVQDNDIAWVLFLDPADEREALDALSAGASGMLPPSANLTEMYVLEYLLDRMRGDSEFSQSGYLGH